MFADWLILKESGGLEGMVMGAEEVEEAKDPWIPVLSLLDAVLERELPKGRAKSVEDVAKRDRPVLLLVWLVLLLDMAASCKATSSTTGTFAPCHNRSVLSTSPQIETYCCPGEGALKPRTVDATLERAMDDGQVVQPRPLLEGADPIERFLCGSI